MDKYCTMFRERINNMLLSLEMKRDGSNYRVCANSMTVVSNCEYEVAIYNYEKVRRNIIKRGNIIDGLIPD